MRKQSLLLLGFASLSASIGYVQANEHVTQSESQFYAGADIEFAGRTRVSQGGASIKDTSDIGFSFYAGYEFDVDFNNLVKPSLELQYRSFGDASFSTVSMDSYGVFLNGKAKLFVLRDYGNIYFAPMFGIGHVSLDVKDSSTKQSASESEVGYQFGMEIGTRLENNIDLNAGYRTALVDIDNIDYRLDGFYLGISYAF